MKKRPEWQNKPLKINKKEKWALLFKFNRRGDRAEYYLKPVSELTGEKKETFLTIAQHVNDVPSHWKDQFKVNMYYYAEKLMGESESYYLFVGDESSLKRVKEEFIKDNSVDTEFEPILSDMVKPETKRHFEGIIEAYDKKDRSHVLVFNSKGDRVTYYLRPISELTGNKKKDFLKIARKKYKEFGSIWENEYDVDLYYHKEPDAIGYGSDYTHLFVGGKETLERLRDEFIEINQHHNVEFSPELSDMVKPETRRHFEGIIEHMNYDNLVNNIIESLEFDLAGQRVLDNGKKIADYEVDVVQNVTKEEVMDYFQTDTKDPVIKYLKQLKLPKRFTYVWIQFIKLLPRLRGQGKGSEIINSLALSYPPGTLLALSAEEVSTGKTASSLEKLKKFYKQNGFTLIKSQDKVFGFRVV